MPDTSPAPVLPGDRMAAALGVLMHTVHDRATRKLCRPEGPRVTPNELYDFESGAEGAVTIGGRIYQLEVTLTCVELNVLTDEELTPEPAAE